MVDEGYDVYLVESAEYYEDDNHSSYFDYLWDYTLGYALNGVEDIAPIMPRYE